MATCTRTPLRSRRMVWIYGATVCVALCAMLAPVAAQAGQEFPDDPNAALAAFKQRAWSLKKGRIQVISDSPREQARQTFTRIQSLIRQIDVVFQGMQTKRDAEDLVIWIVPNRNEYLSAVHLVAGADGSHTGGMAAYRGDETYVFVNGLRWSTLQHECWHAANSIFVPDMPRWMDEGIAVVFGDGSFIGEQFAIGELSASRLDLTRSLIASDDFVPLTMFFQQGAQWHHQLRHGMEQGRIQYIQAWAIMHFLLFGDDGAHRHHVNGMLRRMNRGQSWHSALHDEIGSSERDLAALERAIVRYFRDATPVDTRAMHRDLLNWAEERADVFSDGRSISTESLRDLLVASSGSEPNAAAKRDLQRRINVRRPRRGEPPIIRIDPLHGLSWTIRWTAVEPEDDESERSKKSAEDQAAAQYEASVVWGLSS